MAPPSHSLTRSLERRLDQVESFAMRLARWLCLGGGLGLILGMVATCWSALGKLGLRQLNAIYGPDGVPAFLTWVRPLRGEDEVVAFAVAFALFAALPLVTLHRKHIQIDLLQPVLGARLNHVLTLVGDLILLILAYFLVRQQWNLIFRPARPSRGQEPLWDLIWAGEWQVIWGQRFLDNQQTQVMGLEFWPLHVWAELCSVLFFAAAAIALLGTLRAGALQNPGKASP